MLRGGLITIMGLYSGVGISASVQCTSEGKPTLEDLPLYYTCSWGRPVLALNQK